MANNLKYIFPHFLGKRIKDLIRKSSKKYSCPVCEGKISHFNSLDDYYFEMWDKYQYIHSIFNSETFYYLKYHCPLCQSSDRNRLYALFLRRKFETYKLNKEKKSFLDIAPDKNLSAWIKKQHFIDYRSVDLFMKEADDKADVTDMKIYKDEYFDIILCSHVLEHIKEDKKAIKEIYRILKPDGIAIIMVPILLTLTEDLEDEKYNTNELHWKYYGQNDHVRMYSKQGFLDKLMDTGFFIDQLGKDYFGKDIFNINGIHPRSILYVVRKKK